MLLRLFPPYIVTPPPCFKYILLYNTGNSLLHVSSKNLATCSCVRSLGGKGAAIEKDDKEVGDLAKMALLTSLTTPPQLQNLTHPTPTTSVVPPHTLNFAIGYLC